MLRAAALIVLCGLLIGPAFAQEGGQIVIEESPGTIPDSLDELGWSETHPGPGAHLFWATDSLLLPNRGPMSEIELCRQGPPRGDFRLPPRPGPRSLGLIFTDGRPARWDSLRVPGGRLYWPLQRACAALGMRLRWDPALMRGELVLDSLHCGFVVGGEVLHCGDRALQLPDPILYISHQLMLPLGFVPLAVDSLLGGRFRFRADSLLMIQAMPGPRAADPIIQQVGRRTYIKWPAPGRPVAHLLADGAGGLRVDLEGFYIDPLDPPRPESREGACLWALEPHAGGTAYLFQVAPAVEAWRLQWRENTNELRLTLSANQGDLEYPAYFPFRSPRPPLGAQAEPGAVILVLPPEREGADMGLSAAAREQVYLLRDIGERIRGQLEQAGHCVVLLDDRQAGGWVPEVNARSAAVCLCLRPDIAGQDLLPGGRVVTLRGGPGAQRLLPLEAATDDPSAATNGTPAVEAPAGKIPGVDLRPWEGIAAAHREGTREFAWLVGDCLATAFPGQFVRRQAWPAAFLTGLDLPGAVLYLGDFDAAAGEPPGEDGSLEDRLASAIARSIGVFLLRAEGAGRF